MKFRTGFVTNSSSTCFFLGKQGEEKVTVDDAFRVIRDGWNDYYDCMEKLIAYLLDLLEAENSTVRYPEDVIEYLEEKDVFTRVVKVLFAEKGSIRYPDDVVKYLKENDYPEDVIKYVEEKDLDISENILCRELGERFGVYFDSYELKKISYDRDQKKIRRERWLAAETYKEARAADRDNLFGGAFTYFYGLLEGMYLPFGMYFPSRYEDKKIQRCEQCQIIIDMYGGCFAGVYDKIEARCLGRGYHDNWHG